ncbi:MAG: adenylyl-sulfate kinase [Solidesulfovibrio sp.]|uniref:adenylyl-sulfate kinase n=1 Tax=Solidesulfovibrio sp. TaxID=2910990 RepID=UPI002B221219|nr:adenylyl-sulfate kinase [Solidesulfovibrio sp.]MEA4857633.1 adenylyl-sulfate kinase [Solidesulfovibrio sp.]
MSATATLWFTGLPGSGKSAVARAVEKTLALAGLRVLCLELDARRKAYFPNPAYSEAERNEAYRLIAEEAAKVARADTYDLILLDASAPKRAMRDYARRLLPRFAEVHVRCSLATAMAREAARPEGLVMAGLYAKAMLRKTTGRDFPGLGQVIGVDVPFEEDPAAECLLDAEHLSVEACRDAVLAFLRAWLPRALAPRLEGLPPAP